MIREVKVFLNLSKCFCSADKNKTINNILALELKILDFDELKILPPLLCLYAKLIELDDNQINTQCQYVWDLFVKATGSMVDQKSFDSNENWAEIYKTFQQLKLNIKSKGVFLKINNWDKIEILILALSNIYNAKKIVDVLAAVYEIDINCFKEKKITDFIEILYPIALNNIVHIYNITYIRKAIDVLDSIVPPSLIFYKVYGESNDPDLINLLDSMRIMENRIFKDKRITDKNSKDIKLGKRHFDIGLFLNYLSAPKVILL